MRKVEQVLPNAVTHPEALRAAKAQAILRDWPTIVGDALARRSRPDRYGRGTVWVAVTGSAWAQEMRMRKETFLARLSELAGDSTLFTDIRFGVRPLPQTEATHILGPSGTPEPIAETPASSPEPEADVRELSIREIAERRLAKMRAKSDLR